LGDEVKEGKLNRLVILVREKRNANRVLMGKTKGRRQL
jgi:hypothetical protein